MRLPKPVIKIKQKTKTKTKKTLIIYFKFITHLINSNTINPGPFKETIEIIEGVHKKC